MARALLKLATILSLVFSILLASSSQTTLSSDIDDDDDEEYVLDNPPENFRSRSRFLASVVKKGTRCNADRRDNVCNGVSANKGTSLIYCCKKHCRNVLGDENNCGICGNKCRFAESCCNGRCTNIFSNVNHCGKCKKKCAPGVGCHYGTCGYA